MKRFSRSAAGKAVAFLLLVLSITALALGTLEIIVMYESESSFYQKTEEELREAVCSTVLGDSGYFIVASAIFENLTIKDPDSQWVLTDSTGAVIAESDNIYNGSDLIPVITQQFVLSEDEHGNKWLQSIHASWDEEEMTEVYTLQRTPSPSLYAPISRIVHIAYAMRYRVFAVMAVAALLALISFSSLMCTAARRPDTEELCPEALDPLPFDVLLFLYLCLIGSMLAILDASFDNTVLFFILIAVFFFIALCLTIYLFISMASRIKQKMLIKNTVLYRIAAFVIKGIMFCLRWTKKVLTVFADMLKDLPLIAKTVAVSVVIFLIETVFLMNTYDREMLVVWHILEKAILLPLLYYFAISMTRLRKGARALAEGDLEHETSTAGMIGDFRRHGEDLNDIAKGMNIAIDKRLKSERMKAELITNVSHDIKTPLTSIINYSSLISEEDTDNENIRQYSEVLVRQSSKLKILLEDLVEVSKANTGNLEVELLPCDAGVLVGQIAGEYADRFEAASLTPVISVPDGPVTILADGRRMWRVMDNLLANACKYSLEGTRVFISLDKKDGQAVFTVRNTSREMLDMDVNELTERFTRGDSSRNTEGNGLGLAIAKSLTELQGGAFALTVDGDLFKAAITFPVVG